MIRNESHPIRATITIIWVDKYKHLKREFENIFENNLYIPSKLPEKKEILRMAGEINDEFLNDYCVGTFSSKTAHDSYIIKEGLGDQHRSSIDIFNGEDHVKSHVRHIREILNKTIRESKKGRSMPSRCYKMNVEYSLNGLQFHRLSMGNSFKNNLPLLLGWFIAPIITVLNSSPKNINTGNALNNDGGAILRLVNNFSLASFITSLIIIAMIYIVISLIKYWSNENAIRI